MKDISDMEPIMIPADEAQKKTILKDINATEEQLERNKKALKEWIKQNPHLPQNMSDTLLLVFIVQCKNSLERAKERVELYYTRTISNERECFVDIDPASPEIQTNMDVMYEALCRRMTPEGYRVCVFQLVDSDITHYYPLYGVKRLFMAADLRFQEEYLNAGECLVFDCTHFTMVHASRFTPMLIKRMLLASKLIPIRLKKILIINAPSVLEPFFNIVKSLLDKKLKKRLHLYSGDHTSLYQHIPREILPKDYGGDDFTIKELSEYWRHRYLKSRDFLLDKSIREADETKRIGPIKYKPDQLYGVDGSFQSLNLD